MLLTSGCGYRKVPQPVVTPVPAEKKELHPMGYTIQAGAFSGLENAIRLTHSLEQRGLNAYYFRHESGLYKVRFGEFNSRQAARSKAESLISAGIIDIYYIVGPRDYARVRVKVYETANLRKDIVKTAEGFIGLPYRWGGSSPEEGFDCSGLTMAVYRLNGLNLPRNSKDQYTAGNPIGRRKLKKGDLVFFKISKGKKVSHVGVYVGEGKFIHAPGNGKKIRKDLLSNTYYAAHYIGARSYIR
ncbi:MAG: C40 family peptidase [Deltaproteobacteria bacterium]|nr:C40 family peptidase [Deltaproteobacteria bacterium]